MNKNGGLKKLLNNNLFVLIISFVLAFAIWLAYSVYGGEIQEKTYDSVPVSFDSMSVPEQFNLKAFGDYTDLIQVTVSGRKSAVGTSSVEDIHVVANTSGVTTSGKQTLQLSVTTTNPNIDIVSYYPLYVEVYFDSYAEIQIDVTANVTGMTDLGEEYRVGKPTLSINKVTASGPATEVNKIASVSADVNVDKKITATTTFDTSVVPLDKYGNEIQNITIEGAEDIKLTIPIYKKATLPVSVEFTNVPDGIDVTDYTSYSVDEISIEAEESTIDEMTSLSVGNIDFTELANTKKRITFNVKNLPGIIVTDGTEKVVVTVDLSSFATKKVYLHSNSITISNPTKFKASIDTDTIAVTVIGSSKNIKEFSSANLVANLPIDEKAKRGKSAQFVTISTDDKSGCWIYGSYKAEYTLS